MLKVRTILQAFYQLVITGCIWAALLSMDQVMWRINNSWAEGFPPFYFLKEPGFYLFLAGLCIVVSCLGWPLAVLSMRSRRLSQFIALVFTGWGAYLYKISYAPDHGYWTGAGDYFHPDDTLMMIGSLFIIYGLQLIITIQFPWLRVGNPSSTLQKKEA